jgi:hypothetical protein
MTGPQWPTQNGSQKKVPLLGSEEHEITVIGSGVYVPANPQAEEQHIGVRATQKGHNTAYRAELIAILGHSDWDTPES